jgi:hypothetical protein
MKWIADGLTESTLLDERVAQAKATLEICMMIGSHTSQPSKPGSI